MLCALFRDASAKGDRATVFRLPWQAQSTANVHALAGVFQEHPRRRAERFGAGGGAGRNMGQDYLGGGAVSPGTPITVLRMAQQHEARLLLGEVH
jgi:hypothetical protein